ncbi:unnamed protein product [Prunus brigantina]
MVKLVSKCFLWLEVLKVVLDFMGSYGIIIVNTTRKLNTQEPFVLASQATQVFYVNGVKNKIWSFVVETNPRNAYEMTNDEIEPYLEAETQIQSMHATQNDAEDNEID